VHYEVVCTARRKWNKWLALRDPNLKLRVNNMNLKVKESETTLLSSAVNTRTCVLENCTTLVSERMSKKSQRRSTFKDSYYVIMVPQPSKNARLGINQT
jgi:hypothetical protein